MCRLACGRARRVLGGHSAAQPLDKYAILAAAGPGGSAGEHAGRRRMRGGVRVSGFGEEGEGERRFYPITFRGGNAPAIRQRGLM